MLKLNILKPVTIVGREYDAGDSVEVHKTLLHYEKKKVSNGVKVLLDAGLIEVVSGKDDTYKVKGDIVVNVLGLEFKKDAEFVAPKVFDYVDEVDYPKWIARGVTDGLWSLDDGVIHVTGVTMSDASINVDVGATKQLSVTVAPAEAADKTGVWASSNTAVATVDQTGKVTGVAAGNADITFTTTDGGKVGTTAAVIAVAVIVPTSVSMSPASPTTTVGGTVKLSVSITPANSTDKTGVWTSATPAVATVAQDGTVTGVAEGTSEITFTTNSGAKTAKRTVTVGPAA
ncbi:Ig domain-containing protein [Salmonella enterica]|nr:Ig domain-containing protein [Salmonella enterica]